MDDYNSMNFSCEPMGGQQFPDPNSQEPKKPEKKGKITGKLVALLLAVAIVGSVGGAAPTAAHAGHPPDKKTQNAPQGVTGTTDVNHERKDQAG